MYIMALLCRGLTLLWELKCTKAVRRVYLKTPSIDGAVSVNVVHVSGLQSMFCRMTSCMRT